MISPCQKLIFIIFTFVVRKNQGRKLGCGLEVDLETKTGFPLALNISGLREKIIQIPECRVIAYSEIRVDS